MFSRWAKTNPDSLFESLDHMPSPLVQAQAAYNLLAKYRNSGVLNDSEVDDLQDMVNANAQKITRVATYSNSFDGNTQDREAELLRRELESNWSNDGVERIFELSEN